MFGRPAGPPRFRDRPIDGPELGLHPQRDPGLGHLEGRLVILFL